MYYLSYLHMINGEARKWLDLSHGGECTACLSESVVNDQQHFLYKACI